MICWLRFLKEEKDYIPGLPLSPIPQFPHLWLSLWDSLTIFAHLNFLPRALFVISRRTWLNTCCVAPIRGQTTEFLMSCAQMRVLERNSTREHPTAGSNWRRICEEQEDMGFMPLSTTEVCGACSGAGRKFQRCHETVRSEIWGTQERNWPRQQNVLHQRMRKEQGTLWHRQTFWADWRPSSSRRQSSRPTTVTTEAVKSNWRSASLRRLSIHPVHLQRLLWKLPNLLLKNLGLNTFWGAESGGVPHITEGNRKLVARWWGQCRRTRQRNDKISTK